MYTSTLFLLLTLLTVASAIVVITSSNIVISAIALVSVFLLSSILTMMVGLNFLAITLILIYVGAVAIFFLFAIMMLDIKIKKITIGSEIFFFLIGIFCIFSIAPSYVSTLMWNPNSLHEEWHTLVASLDNIQAIGQILYTDLFIHFLIAGYILFITMAGVLMLTLDPPKKDVKKQNIATQLERVNTTTIKKHKTINF